MDGLLDPEQGPRGLGGSELPHSGRGGGDRLSSFHRGVWLLGWGHSELMTDFQKRLWLARVFLVAAIVLVALAHLLPTQAEWLHRMNPSVGQRSWLAEGWREIRRNVMIASTGTASPETLIAGGIALCICLFLLSLPLLPGFFARARPLAWVAGILAAGLAGWVQYHLVVALGIRMAPGAHVLCAGLWLAAAGLLVIPKAGTPDASHDWKAPVVVVSMVAIFLGLPSLFRSRIDHWLEFERISACKSDIFAIGFVIEDYDPPPHGLREGWGAFIVGPAPLGPYDSPAKVPWRPVFHQPPDDPWGHPYHYAREGREDGDASDIPRTRITSDGPDGIPGNADDVSEEVGPYIGVDH